MQETLSKPDSPLLRMLVDLAVEAGAPEPSQVHSIVEDALTHQRSAIRALLDAEVVREGEFLAAVSRRFYIPWLSTEESEATPSDQKLLARIALRHHLLQVAGEEGTFTLATYDPLDHVARTAVRQAITGKVRFVMATRKFILNALRIRYGVGADTFEQLLEEREGQGADLDMAEEVNVLDADDSEASVMKFVNQIIREALVERATDIHVEPLGTDLRIRYRIDGVLHEVPVPPQIKLLQASVISRVKIMSNLDIAERRVPQDGRINLEFNGQAIDVRVATIPSVTGETISLRLLGQEIFDFPRLGLDVESERIVRELCALPNGIILVTGPTGSGKSTSLYTFLSSLNTKERRIVTIEDPVEHKLPGVIQIAIKPEISLTFAAALRSVLRGDPNVIMVGEMRDAETAETAIRSALTGHLVFSTLHTNDAVSGITRLIDMGIEPFLVGSAVRAFIAQRLVRRLCPACRVPANHSVEHLRHLGFPATSETVTYGPGNCEACRHTGYAGRTAIYEICRVSSRMQELIQQKVAASVLKNVAMEEGMVPLRMAGWKRVKDGATSIEEVLRVTAADVSLLDE